MAKCIEYETSDCELIRQRIEQVGYLPCHDSCAPAVEDEFLDRTSPFGMSRTIGDH